VLVVDDEPNGCDVLRDALSRYGHRVTTCTDGQQALLEARRQTFDAVFLDIRMPGMNGVQVLRGLRKSLPRAAFIMITACAESELVDQSLESGAFVCLPKPLSIFEVVELVQGLYDDRKTAAKRRP
jgi:CheY-like chemotaxis protein